MPSRTPLIVLAALATSVVALSPGSDAPIPGPDPIVSAAVYRMASPAAANAEVIDITTPLLVSARAPGPKGRPVVRTPTGGLDPLNPTGWTDSGPGPAARSRVDRIEFERPTLVSGIGRTGIAGAGGGDGLGSTAAFDAPAPVAGAAPQPLDSVALRRAIRRQIPKVRACYERALKQDPRLAGRMMIAWKVQPDGDVRDVRLSEDDLQQPRLSRCVVNTVAGWRFPAGTEEIGVEYPLVLSARTPG